jgi:hypothetical protein
MYEGTSASVCQKVLTVRSQNNCVWTERSSTNLSVFVTQTLSPALKYWEGDANLIRFWAFGSVAYCGDSKMFCSVSHGSVTVRSTPQLYSQHFAPLPICIKMFHSQYCLVVTVIHIPFVHSQTYVYVHIFFTVWRRWSGKINKKWEGRECRLPYVGQPWTSG